MYVKITKKQANAIEKHIADAEYEMYDEWDLPQEAEKSKVLSILDAKGQETTYEVYQNIIDRVENGLSIGVGNVYMNDAECDALMRSEHSTALDIDTLEVYNIYNKSDIHSDNIFDIIDSLDVIPTGKYGIWRND